MKKYDVNDSGIVNEHDATFVKQYINKMFNFKSYDINDDGEINISDYMEWRRHFDLSDIDSNGLLQEIDANLIWDAINEKRTTLRMDVSNDNVVSFRDVTQIQELANKASALSKKLDVNNDGVISTVDGMILYKIIEVCRDIIRSMDVNKDGDINMHDVTDIQQNID